MEGCHRYKCKYLQRIEKRKNKEKKCTEKTKGNKNE